MDEKSKLSAAERTLFLSEADADRLLALGDGDAALLYLHILRRDGQYIPTAAAHNLGRSLDEIKNTAERLRRCGLLRPGMETPRAPAEELPEYTGQYVARRAQEDSVFRGLQMECRQVLGHDLSGADLKTLFGIYDHLGLPAPVIMLLLNFCADRLRRRYGEGRLPTMHAIEKEAFVWVNREIVTEELAEEYIAAWDRRTSEMGKIERALQITGRKPSPTEAKYMEKWFDMGYGADALALAYDRTVTGTGRLAWSYMDKIVESWYNKKLFTVSEIEKGDLRGGKSSAKGKPSTPAAEPSNDDFKHLMDKYVNT